MNVCLDPATPLALSTASRSPMTISAAAVSVTQVDTVSQWWICASPSRATTTANVR